MMSFVTNELVWAMQREREEEIRRIRPHTAHKPDPERTTIRRENDDDSLGLWIAPSLRGTGR